MFNNKPVLYKVSLSILIFLGSFLILLGNTFPWPCSPGSWRALCDPSLDVYFVNDFSVGVFIAGLTLMLLLEVNLYNYPMNFVAWASYWIILYLLLIAKIRTDSTFPSLHYTWVHIKWNLATIAITPISLLSYWLILRPTDIKQKHRKITLVCLFALLLITTFFLFFAVIALDLQLRFSFELKEVIRIAPVVILAGTLLSIGAEYAELRMDKQQPVQDNEEEQKDVDDVENGVN